MRETDTDNRLAIALRERDTARMTVRTLINTLGAVITERDELLKALEEFIDVQTSYENTDFEELKTAIFEELKTIIKKAKGYP